MSNLAWDKYNSLPTADRYNVANKELSGSKSSFSSLSFVIGVVAPREVSSSNCFAVSRM